MNEFQKKYRRLDQIQRKLLQIVAFQHGEARYDQLHRQSKMFDLRQSNGRALTQTFVRQSLRDWAKKRLLSGYPARPVSELMDMLIREGVSSDDSQQLLALVNNADRWVRRSAVLDFYVAFYSQDTDAWKTARRAVPDGSLPLLEPFCKKTFQRLASEMQAGYFSFVMPSWITEGGSDNNAMQEFRQRLDESTLPAVMLPRLLEWGLASGDRSLLQRVHQQTGGKANDVEGCLRLLDGDFDEAFTLLAGTLSKRASKKNLTKLGGLPSLLATLSVITGQSGANREQALKATMTALKPGATPYADGFAIAQQGLLFMGAPGDAKTLVTELNAAARSPLAKWTAGCIGAWLASDAETSISGLTDAATAFRSRGCFWLAAESHAAAGRSKLKTAKKQREKAEQLHSEHGTHSMVDFVQPKPLWSRTLDAIASLGSPNLGTTTAVSSTEPTDRLIFEIHHSAQHFSLDVFQQVRKGSQWSKGRKVALSRLFHQHAEPEFSFLTPEDRALCQTLRHWTERGSYGYPEEYTDLSRGRGHVP